MDSVGLGQSWEEVKTEARKNRMECENCLKLENEIVKLEATIIDKGFEILRYKTEIDALERRVEELEELLEEFNFLAERPKPRNTKTDVELWNEWCDY